MSIVKIPKYRQTGSGSAADLIIAYTLQPTTIKLVTKYKIILINRSQEILDENFHVHLGIVKFQSIGKQEVVAQQI